MPKVSRLRLATFVMTAVLTVCLVLAGQGLILRDQAPLPNSSVLDAIRHGPTGLEEVVPSETLVRDHPFIYAGIHLDKIYELNLNSRTFSADGQLWLEWLPEVDELLRNNNTKPAELITLANRIETWDSTFEVSSESPQVLSGGRHMQTYHFSSRFYDDEVDFKRDPFDVLRLPIIIELKPLWTAQKYADVRLLPEAKPDALVGSLGTLSGYQLKEASFKPYIHRLPTQLGTWFRPHRSQVRLEITYQSTPWPGFVNWIIPLMIINAVVLMAPSLEGTMSEVRITVPSTALLTLIFLQQSYHSSLPKLPYTTFLDDLFTASYVIAMVLFGLFTWGSNLYSAAPTDKKAIALQRINTIDLWFQVGAASLLVSTALISWGQR